MELSPTFSRRHHLLSMVALIANDIIYWALTKEVEMHECTEAKSAVANQTLVIENRTGKIKKLNADYSKALFGEVEKEMCGESGNIVEPSAKQLEEQMHRWRGIIETTQGLYQAYSVAVAGLEAQIAGKNRFFARWEMWKYFGNDEGAAAETVAFFRYITIEYSFNPAVIGQTSDEWNQKTRDLRPSWERRTGQGAFPVICRSEAIG